MSRSMHPMNSRRRYHETSDPKRSGWILHSTWFENLRWSGEVFLFVHELGSRFERIDEVASGQVYTMRIMDLDAAEVEEWCRMEGIGFDPSPITGFEKVVHIDLDTDDKLFAFKMRWPSWT